MSLKKIGKELIPFGQQSQATIWLIIACVFQFLLFFAPQLAEEAMAGERQINQIRLSPISRSQNLDDLAINFLINRELTINPYTIKEKEIEIAPEEEIVAKEVKTIRTGVHTITAYNSLPEQTNDQPCITANGFNVCQHGIEDTIAANFLKFGTKVRIPDLFGDRIFIVRDRMNQRYPYRVDVWMLEKTDAIEFGIKQAKIEIVELIN